jgi:hypothetical protein
VNVLIVCALKTHVPALNGEETEEKSLKEEDAGHELTSGGEKYVLPLPPSRSLSLSPRDKWTSEGENIQSV